VRGACVPGSAGGCFIAEAIGEEATGEKGGGRESDRVGGERGRRDGSPALLTEKAGRGGEFLASRGATSSPTTTDDAAAASCGSFRPGRRRTEGSPDLGVGACGARHCPLFCLAGTAHLRGPENPGVWVRRPPVVASSWWARAGGVVEGKLTSEFRPRSSDRRCCGDLRFGRIPIQLYIKFFLEVLTFELRETHFHYQDNGNTTFY
jgi:hypothetical protein